MADSGILVHATRKDDQSSTSPAAQLFAQYLVDQKRCVNCTYEEGGDAADNRRDRTLRRLTKTLGRNIGDIAMKMRAAQNECVGDDLRDTLYTSVMRDLDRLAAPGDGTPCADSAR